MDIKLIYAVIIALILTNAFLLFSLHEKDTEVERTIDTIYASNPSNFTLLNPEIADLSTDEFLKLQENLIVTYKPLKEEIINITKNRNGIYGIYFEDLTTGAWIGINEKEEFVPASLLKTPLMGAILKKVERGELSLNATMILTKDDLNNKSGTLYARGEGYNITIRRLVKFLANESDNTAENVLTRSLTVKDVIESQAGLGLTLPNNLYPTLNLSPKEYSNIFRSLYYSSYMRRTFSQLALSMLSNTTISFIRSGVPDGIIVSHKFGIYKSLGIYHDCGIIYYPKRPYMLCIMSKNTDRQEAESVMYNISKTVYDYVNGS
jgi:beta-lactamase class A